MNLYCTVTFATFPFCSHTAPSKTQHWLHVGGHKAEDSLPSGLRDVPPVGGHSPGLLWGGGSQNIMLTFSLSENVSVLLQN